MWPVPPTEGTLLISSLGHRSKGEPSAPDTPWQTDLPCGLWAARQVVVVFLAWPGSAAAWLHQMTSGGGGAAIASDLASRRCHRPGDGSLPLSLTLLWLILSTVASPVCFSQERPTLPSRGIQGISLAWLEDIKCHPQSALC